jgi:hypothetical protein
MAGEVRLIVKTDLGGDAGGALALEEKLARHVDARAEDIRVRGDVVALFEASHEVGNAPVEDCRRVAERDVTRDVSVQIRPKPAGHGRLRLAR